MATRLPGVSPGSSSKPQEVRAAAHVYTPVARLIDHTAAAEGRRPEKLTPKPAYAPVGATVLEKTEGASQLKVDDRRMGGAGEGRGGEDRNESHGFLLLVQIPVAAHELAVTSLGRFRQSRYSKIVRQPRTNSHAPAPRAMHIAVGDSETALQERTDHGTESPLEYFRRKRLDPNWGFEP